MQRQDKPDGNDPPRPVPAVVKGKAKAPIRILPHRGAVQRGRRRRVRTLMTRSRYHPVPMPARSSDESDEDSIPSRGSLESMDSADELGSLSNSEDSGSDFIHENEPYSPPAPEGEAPEDKILVTKPPVKNSADVEESVESGETPAEQDENEKRTEKSPEDIADKKAVSEQELLIPDKGLEINEKDRKSLKEIADKEALLKKELRIIDNRSAKKTHLNQGCSSASKDRAEDQSEPGPAEVCDAGPAQEPAAKRLKESE